MKKLLLLLSFLPLCIWGNEGMWLPCCLSKQTQQVMKEMGLELSSEQLYNPGGKALANAVVSFGGFCSGVVVSPDGLVFTNHHCGYDAIQQHSSVEHDYLRDGFVADSLSKELPNPDLFVSFLIRTEDVTERVLQAIPVGTKENDRALIEDSISTLLAQEAVANDTLLRAEITPFYGGNEFYLSVYKDYYDGTETDWEKLIEGAGRIGKSRLVIDDTSGISITEMRSKCRKYKLEHNLGIIIIDYLQLMTGNKKSDSRQQEISDISRSLKEIARELNVPVIALSQLSRAVEQRPDHRPMLSDLRESGAIEQDADVVMFIYRDDYYNKDTEKKNIAEIIIAKQRNGPIGTVELVWLPNYTKFANMQK